MSLFRQRVIEDAVQSLADVGSFFAALEHD